MRVWHDFPVGGLDFCLLGGLRVLLGDQALELTAPKPRLAMAVLLLERDRVVPSNRLVDLLWRDDDTAGVSALQVYVSRLRTMLEPDRPPRSPSTVLVSQPPGYRLTVPREALDIHRFEDAVATGRTAARSGDAELGRRRLDEALALWTGPLLPEFSDEPFVRTDAERLGELRLSALEAAGEIRLELGDDAGAHTVLASVAAEHPMREHLNGLVALAEYRLGRQAKALRTIDRCRRALAETAGLEPGRQLRQLEADMLDHAPSLLPASQASANRPVTVSAPPITASAPSIVGRLHELEQLTAALDAADARRGGTVVIVGEAGVGKSRLAQAAIDLARARGADTAWARCPESRSTPPFWAFTQLMEQLPERQASTSPDVAELERFGHYRSAFETLASDRLTVAVIDDLQWADADSLGLLTHLAADLATRRSLLLVTVRSEADSRSEALVDCLAEIARSPGAIDLTLGGWTVADVADWLATFDADRQVAEALHARTGGHPLFVKELTELLAAEGSLGDAQAVASSRSTPASVTFVVRRRANRLPPPTQQLLLVAAVIGRSFDLDTLCAASGLDLDAVVEHVAAALDAGLLTESGGEFNFSHALVADALAAEVNAVRRASIHAAIARSLAQRAESGFGANVAAIAHHARQGLMAGTAELAIEAGQRAAELAAKQFAYEDAAAHWAGVADVLRRARPKDAASLAHALTEQGRSLVDIDQVLRAKEPILAAVHAAEQAGLTTAMADALALLHNVHVWTNEPYGVIDTALVDALRRTIDLIGDRDPARRTVLLGALVAELAFADRPQYEAAVDAAIAAARATGDPVLIARVLCNSINRPGTHAQRLVEATEVLALSEQHDLGPNLLMVGHFHVAESHLELGEFDLAAQQLEIARGWARWLPVTRLQSQLLWFEAALAILACRYDEATVGMTSAVDLHRRGRLYDAETFALVSQVAVAFECGGLEHILPFVAVDESAYGRVIGESMAAGALEVGDLATARALTAGFGPTASFSDDFVTLFCATAALHVRVELGDPAGAAAAEAVLAPFADRWAGAGNSPISMGPVALALARYAAFVGDDPRARALFDQVITGCERSGAPAWLARSLTHYAGYLRSQGERVAADEAAARARELANRHGLVYVNRRLDAAELG